MTHKEMTQAILSAKAGYIFTQRELGISFEKIGKKLNPQISKQATHKILENYFRNLSH